MAVELRRVFNDKINKKPKTVFDKRFPFTKSLVLGEKGQMDVLLRIKSVELKRDEDGNDIKEVVFNVLEAEKVDEEATRK